MHHYFLFSPPEVKVILQNTSDLRIQEADISLGDYFFLIQSRSDDSSIRIDFLHDLIFY